MYNFDKQIFLNDMNTVGYHILHDVLDEEFISQAKKQIETAIESENTYHHEKQHKDYGMVLLCSLYGGAFIDLFNNEKLMMPFNCILGDGCIVYAYTSSSMPPASTNYSRRIHVDCPRIIPGYITNVGATILLNDFTEDNGATYFLPCSQQIKEEPAEGYFYQNAKRLIAKAGSVWYFNARIWHAGGMNNTKVWRHALTINMCRPWMKQRIDIPRAMSIKGAKEEKLPESAIQKLGYYSQVPCSYEEYYVPVEKRKFKQKTE